MENTAMVMFAFLLGARAELIGCKCFKLVEIRSEVLTELAGDALNDGSIRWKLHAETNRRGWLLRNQLPKTGKAAKERLALILKVEERVKYLQELSAAFDAEQGLAA